MLSSRARTKIQIVLPHKRSLWSSEKYLQPRKPWAGSWGFTDHWLSDRGFLWVTLAHFRAQAQSRWGSCPPKSESLKQGSPNARGRILGYMLNVQILRPHGSPAEQKWGKGAGGWGWTSGPCDHTDLNSDTQRITTQRCRAHFWLGVVPVILITILAFFHAKSGFLDKFPTGVGAHVHLKIC